MMKTFVHRPIPVQAAQWFPGMTIEGVDTVNPNLTHPLRDELFQLDVQQESASFVGDVRLNPGDWVVKYPGYSEVVADADFQRFFEPVSE